MSALGPFEDFIMTCLPEDHPCRVGGLGAYDDILLARSLLKDLFPEGNAHGCVWGTTEVLAVAQMIHERTLDAQIDARRKAAESSERLSQVLPWAK